MRCSMSAWHSVTILQWSPSSYPTPPRLPIHERPLCESQREHERQRIPRQHRGRREALLKARRSWGADGMCGARVLSMDPSLVSLSCTLDPSLSLGHPPSSSMRRSAIRGKSSRLIITTGVRSDGRGSKTSRGGGMSSSSSSSSRTSRTKASRKSGKAVIDDEKFEENAQYDLGHLLGLLGLSEGEVVAELSKKNRALLEVGEERRDCSEEPQAQASKAITDGVTHRRKSLAPWVLLDDIGMRREDVSRVVKSYPLLLTVSADHARRVVAWLRERAGLSSTQLVKVLKSSPAIIRCDVEERLEPHAVWLEREGLDKKGINKVISKLPQVMSVSIEGNLDIKTAWLREYLGLTQEGVAHVLKTFPAILSLSLDNLDGKAKWMEERLRVDRAFVAKILRATPSLFGCNVESYLEPKMKWLLEDLGLHEEDLAAVLRTSPNILIYSVAENLEPTVAWLRQRIGLNQKGVAAMVRTFPQILGLSPKDNMDPKIAWLKDALDVDDERVLVLVKTCPQLFGYSVTSNLGPTLDFLHRVLGGSAEEVRKAVFANPTLLRYSLKKRMIPRAEAIESAGLGKPVFEHLKPVACYTSVRFDAWLDSEILERGLPSRREKPL